MLPRLWSKGDSDVCRESEAVSPQFESRRRMRHFHRDECKGEAGEAARRWTSAEVPRAAGASAEPGERTAAAESMCPSPGGGRQRVHRPLRGMIQEAHKEPPRRKASIGPSRLEGSGVRLRQHHLSDAFPRFSRPSPLVDPRRSSQ